MEKVYHKAVFEERTQYMVIFIVTLAPKPFLATEVDGLPGRHMCWTSLIGLSRSPPKSTASIRPTSPQSHCYRPNCVPPTPTPTPNSLLEALTPSASAWLYLEIETLKRWDKMGSSGWALIRYDLVSLEEEIRTHTEQRPGEDTGRRQPSPSRGSCAHIHKPRRRPRKKPVLPTP